ncbi:MAG: hypothetical protein AAF843_12500 [Bacteroidota bacterium]
MNKNTPEVYHQKLSMAFHSMIALPLVAFVYLFLEDKHNDLEPILYDQLWVSFVTYGFSLMAFFLIFLGRKNFKRALAKINSEDHLKKRFDHYVSLSMKNYLLIGLASAVLVAGLLLTNSAFFIVEYVIVLFFLSIHRPTPDKYIRDLRLQGNEKKCVRNKLEFPG